MTTRDYGFAGQFTGGGFPDGASISASISKSLGLADLGIGIGSEANPAPYARPNGTAELVDAKGNPYTMRFNEFSSVVESTDPIGRATTLLRNANNLVTQSTVESDGELPNGTVPGQVITEIDYDERGNVTAQREAAGTALERQTLFEYEPVFNNATKITDPAGFETTFEYDAKGNLTKTTDALNGELISTFDPANGLALSRQDPNGDLTSFGYDALGNLQTITDAELNVTGFQRDTAGRVTSQIEGVGTPEARSTSFTYDAMNRVETVTDGTGAMRTTRYDAAGNVVETEDATGIVVVRAYDEQGREILENNPVQVPVTRSYDANGNVETIATAVPGQSVTFVYDAANRVVRVTDPLLNDRLFGYDAQNNRVRVTDARQAALPNGVPTTFVFDPLDRQIRRTNQLSETWSFEFDRRDNPTRTVDAKGQAIERVYDELSRPTTVTLLEADGVTVEDSITFTYDANGNRLTAIDGDSSLAFTYDALNRIETAATLADPGTVLPPVVLGSVYDAVGDRIQLQHGPDGVLVDGTWAFGYDAAARLTTLAHPAGDPLNPVSLSYDLADRLTGITFPNAVDSQLSYGPDSRLARIDHVRGTIELASFGYSYGDDGLIESITEPGGTRSFSYDAFQRLTSGGFATAPESYSYDEEGNRITSHLSTAHQHDDANRLISDDTFTYSYDANGNLETKTEISSGATTTYVWDVQKRLTRIDFPNGTSASYRYDADGRRIEKDVAGTVTRYLYDDDDILLEFDGTNALVARYGHGVRVDQPLVLERNGQVLYYHIDHLGSPRFLTDAAGAVANLYDTGAFGLFETRIEPVANPFTFTAREFDPESGLHFYRARVYDPDSGRFLQEDPRGFDAGDLNLYGYVFNNPVHLTDPTGQTVAVNYASLNRKIALVLLAGGAVATQSDLASREAVEAFIENGGALASELGAGISCLIFRAASVVMSRLGVPVRSGCGATIVQQSGEKPEENGEKPKKKKVPKPGLTGEEGAKDAPSWARGERPNVGESGRDFAERLLDEKCGPGNYEKGPASEHSKIKKWGDRAFQDP